MSVPDETRHFVKCFLTWLNQQKNHSNFNSDVVESIEVAAQCLEAAFEIASEEADNEDSGVATTSSSASNPLPDIDLFEMFQAACIDVSPDRKKQAEDVKNEGNRLMKECKFNEALLEYNRAIRLDATNATFYCNRAAAYIRLSEYEKALADCKLALVYNPNYGKAYARMGIAYSNLRQYDEARRVYLKAIELEPNNQDYKNNLRVAEDHLSNVGQQVLNRFANNGTDFRQLLNEMMADPQMPLAAAEQIATQFPDIFNDFQSQLGEFLNRNGSNNDISRTLANLANVFQMAQQGQPPSSQPMSTPPAGTTDNTTGSSTTPGSQQSPESTTGNNDGTKD